ncbi:hypothetical protein BDK51DRAFT_33387, partial [Blyttiomyces helicus]
MARRSTQAFVRPPPAFKPVAPRSGCSIAYALSDERTGAKLANCGKVHRASNNNRASPPNILCPTAHVCGRVLDTGCASHFYWSALLEKKIGWLTAFNHASAHIDGGGFCWTGIGNENNLVGDRRGLAPAEYVAGVPARRTFLTAHSILPGQDDAIRLLPHVRGYLPPPLYFFFFIGNNVAVYLTRVFTWIAYSIAGELSMLRTWSLVGDRVKSPPRNNAN